MHYRNIKSPKQGGFTLVELLVVMGLIVLLIALAVPAFNFMTGSRSVAGASNIISASLAQTRVDAIGVQRVKGLALFRDTATRRTAAVAVEAKTFSTWSAGTATVQKTHLKGEYVISPAGTQYYLCVADHQDGGSIPLTDTDYWRQLDLTKTQYTAAVAAGANFLDVVQDRDRVLLPSGVDVRGIYNVTVSGVTYDYVTPSLVLFDGYGTVISRAYVIDRKSDLALQMQLDGTSSLAGSPVPFFASPNPLEGRSQIGLMLYESAAFTDASDSFSSQANADTWISNNADAALVNRYNGTLVSGR